MRRDWVCSLLAFVGLLPSAMLAADIGTVTEFLSSPMDGGAQDLDHVADGILTLANTTVFPITIPVTVGFSATTGGVDGGNSGVAGLFMTLNGSAVGDNSGRSMVLNSTFKKPMGVSSVTGTSSSIVNWVGPQGLGFDLQSSEGTGGVGKIETFGGVQSLPDQMDFGSLDAQYAGHLAGIHPTVATNAGLPLPSNEQYEKSVGPVTVATGNLVIGGFGDIDLEGSGVLWVSGGGAVEMASFVGDALSIIPIPEPGTLVMLGLGSLAFLRFRRGRQRVRHRPSVSRVIRSS
jgi:hypothetical protein